jgi:proteasome lid subunit RPN8/RPN11
MSVLRISRAVYDAIRAHGEELYPGECCGALLDRFSPGGSLVEHAVRATNLFAGKDNTRYQIDPAELVKIERDARRQGLGIAGFYHSHPDHPAQWSPTDLAEAHWLGSSYVITAISRGEAAETNSFLLAGISEKDKKFEKEEIEIVDAVPE